MGKIYKDDEYAKGKKCFKCGTETSVFYNKKWDIFTCSKCLWEFENKEGEKLEEQNIESYLKKQVELIGGKAFKFISPGNSGVPDRIVILPGGRIYFIELKAPGEKLRKLQTVIGNKLKKLGCNVLAIDSKEKVDKFIYEVVE